MLIKGRPEGSDITFMNSWYHYPYKDMNGEWQDDFITIVYRDNKTGEKHHETIMKPDYEYYKIKDPYVKDYNQFFIEDDKVDKIVVPFRKLDKSIAKETNNLEFYNYNIQNRCRGENRKLHTDPSIMLSDTNINDHYHYRFNKEYVNDMNDADLKKGYFDIEVDSKWAKGDFTEMGECPVNCCSYLDEKSNTVYTFIPRDSRNPLIEVFEKSVSVELYQELREFVIEKVGGWKQAKRFNVYDLNYNLLFFDDEFELIFTMFQLFHQIDPDFILAWNMAFDIPYVIARLEELGHDPRLVMTNPNYANEPLMCEYYVDERNKNEIPERGDFATISGNIVWLDQMIQYASKRKSKAGSYPDFKLNTIAEMEAGVHKLDYSHITTRIEELPWLDFKTFVFYNVMDVVVQKCIEESTKDVNYIFAKCMMNNTNYAKGHRQTVYLINRFAKEFNDMGLVLGTNNNRWNEKPDKYAGALVGRPENVNDFSKLIINGRPINVINNLFDEDYKSLYPNTTLENNIAPNTLIAAIQIPEQIYDRENFFNNEKYNRAGEFIENMVTDNMLEFHHRWFNMASFEEFLMEDLPEYMNAKGLSSQIERSTNGMYNPFIVTDAPAISPFQPYDGNPFTVMVDSKENYQPYVDMVLQEVR